MSRAKIDPISVGRGRSAQLQAVARFNPIRSLPSLNLQGAYLLQGLAP